MEIDLVLNTLLLEELGPGADLDFFAMMAHPSRKVRKWRKKRLPTVTRRYRWLITINNN